VLVGAGTVRTDDPRLTVRLPGARGRDARKGKGPLRVVLVGRRGLPPKAQVLDRSAATLVLPAGPGPAGLGRALATLARHGVQSLLVEGGATIHGAFIAAGLVDRVALFFAPRLLGAGVPIAAGPGLPMEHALRLGPLTARAVGEDLLITGDVLQAKHAR